MHHLIEKQWINTSSHQNQCGYYSTVAAIAMRSDVNEILRQYPANSLQAKIIRSAQEAIKKAGALRPISDQEVKQLKQAILAIIEKNHNQKIETDVLKIVTTSLEDLGQTAPDLYQIKLECLELFAAKSAANKELHQFELERKFMKCWQQDFSLHQEVFNYISTNYANSYTVKQQKKSSNILSGVEFEEKNVSLKDYKEYILKDNAMLDSDCLSAMSEFFNVNILILNTDLEDMPSSIYKTSDNNSKNVFLHFEKAHYSALKPCSQFDKMMEAKKIDGFRDVKEFLDLEDELDMPQLSLRDIEEQRKMFEEIERSNQLKQKQSQIKIAKQQDFLKQQEVLKQQQLLQKHNELQQQKLLHEANRDAQEASKQYKILCSQINEINSSKWSLSNSQQIEEKVSTIKELSNFYSKELLQYKNTHSGITHLVENFKELQVKCDDLQTQLFLFCENANAKVLQDEKDALYARKVDQQDKDALYASQIYNKEQQDALYARQIYDQEQLEADSAIAHQLHYNDYGPMGNQ